MLGFRNRNTQQLKNSTSIKTLYYSLVHSVLEFGSVIWSQSVSTYVNDLENMQYRFLKGIACITNVPIFRDFYILVHNLVNLDSLLLRRQL